MRLRNHGAREAALPQLEPLSLRVICAAAEVVEQPQCLSTKTPLPLADVVEPPQTPTVVGRRRRPPQPSPDI